MNLRRIFSFDNSLRNARPQQLLKSRFRVKTVKKGVGSQEQWHCGAQSRWTAQSASHAYGGQYSVLPKLDVSDFTQHVIGVPQIAPINGNVPFDGAGQNEDFGLEQITGNPNDRYKFRTSPIRNVS